MIGIERNKPDAIAALRATLPDDLDVTVLPLTVKYPQGAEKMLIKAAARPRGAVGQAAACTSGVVVQNVASVATIAEVFETGLPLIERIVTVTGRGVRQPGEPDRARRHEARGTCSTACGGLTDDAREIVFGGPMMGAAQANLDAPVMKGTTGVVVLTRRRREARSESYPCIRCGHCLDACPVFLNPQLLGQLALAERYDEMAAPPPGRLHAVRLLLATSVRRTSR